MEIVIGLLCIVIGFFIGFFIKRGNIAKVIKLESENNSIRDTNIISQNKIKELEIENKNLIAKFSVAETELKNSINIEERMKKEFENISNRLLKDQSNTLNEVNKQKISEILAPFQTDIKNFKERVETINTENSTKQGELKNHLDNLKNMNDKLSESAQDLSDAMRGKKKLQGDWGEIQLENLLESTSLIKGVDYVVQETHKDLDNTRYRPDVILKLPDNKKLIIDSKVTINSYIEYINTDNEEHLKALSANIRKHVSDLSSKAYHKVVEGSVVDYVIMFIPNEHAFMAALKYDSELNKFAYSKNIAIATPTSLLTILRTAENLLKIEQANKGAEEISKIGADIYSKLDSFVNNFIKIESSLKSALSTYDLAYKQLATGNGNAIKLANSLKEKRLISTEKQMQIDGNDKDYVN